MTAPSSDPQGTVDRYFDVSAGYWRAIYGRQELQGLVYRRRLETVAAWAVEFGLAAGAKALDAGCGAGLMSVELARRGFSVIGTDSSPEMVQTAARLAAEQGLAGRVTIREADVHRLPFGDGEFALIVALGLLPWLHDPVKAVAEFARVLAPGGGIIVTADNRRRLNRLVEPRENPLLRPLRPVKRMLSRQSSVQGDSAPSYRHLPAEVDEMLAGAGIAVARRTTVGYGPFTVMDRSLLPDSVGTGLHERLERYAGGHPRLRGSGWHYVAAGRKGAGRDSADGESSGGSRDHAG
ncbi:MAG: class I SAM-dependent methyltransferase [Solirubrobacteraceae bacterium]